MADDRVDRLADELALGRAAGLTDEQLGMVHSTEVTKVRSILDTPVVAEREKHYRDKMMVEGARMKGRYLLMLDASFQAIREAISPNAPLKIRAENAWKVIDRVDPPVTKQESVQQVNHTISAEGAAQLTVAFQGLRRQREGVVIDDEKHMIPPGKKGNGSD